MSETETPKEELSAAEKKKRLIMKKKLQMKKKMALAKARIKAKREKALKLGGDKKRFEVKQWNAITLWSYENVSADICSICKNSLCSPCNECHALNIDPFDNKDDPKVKKYCTVAFGKCKHAFHHHCIEKWLSMPSVQSAKCPVCGAVWVYDSYDNLLE